jgi:hypothetical protein
VIDRVGGQLIEEIPELRSLEGARTTIDLDHDSRVAAETDVIVDVDVHSWDIAQDVERGAALGRGHVANDIARPIRLDLDLFALRGDGLSLKLERDLSERDDADVDIGSRGADHDDREGFGAEPKRSNGHAVLARQESSNAEGAVSGTRDAASGCSSGRVRDVDRGRSNGDARAGAHHSAMDGSRAGRLCPEGYEWENRNQKTAEEPEGELAHRMARAS